MESLNPAENIVRAMPNTPAPDGDRPLAPFTTNYDLTRSQEDAAMSLLTRWETTLKAASGWDQTNNPEYLYDGNGSDPLLIEGKRQRPHFVKRAFFTAMAENEWGWRRWLYPESIFQKSNLSAPLARRVSRAMAAKAIEFFFASRPYFYCTPVGPSDDGIAEAVQKVAENRLEACKGTAALRDAIQTAFDLGETVIKVTHRRKQELYRKKGIVLVDPSGNPVLQKNGDYISDDQFVVVDGVKAYPDGTVIPDGSQFASGKWARVATHYSGPDISEIEPRCILAPLDAPTLDDAECVLHMYEVTATDLAAMFTDSSTGAQVVQAIDLLRGIGGEPRVGAVDPMAPDINGAVKSTKVKVQEFWVRMDADHDGIAEDVCFVRVDLNDGGSWRPLFYDYTANVTATGKRPFSVIRPVRRRGSWTGIGAMELFEKHQETVDLMLNRWSFATSTSGVLTIFDPSAFTQTDGLDNAELALNDGKYLTLKSGKNIEASLKRIYMEDNIGPEWRAIMEFFLQLAMNESGVQHANDGGIAGLKSTELATGIRDVRAAGDQLFGVFVASLEDGVSSVIDQFVHTLFAKVDDTIVARITEDEGITREWQVSKEQVQGLTFDVRVTLSRYHTAHLMESVNAVLPQCMNYFNLPPQIQVRLEPLMLQLLKAAQIDNARAIAKPIMPVDPVALVAASEFALRLPEEIATGIAPLIQLAQSVLPQEPTTPAA